MSGLPSAPLVTTVTLDADRTLLSGTTVRIHQILLNNDTGATKTVQFVSGDGTFTYFFATCPTGQALPLNVAFMADRGIKALSVGDAKMRVTFFSGNTGS